MHARVSQQTQKARISELQAEVDRLQEELGQDKDAEKIILIGRLANLKETTVRQIHKNLELPMGD
ncbi:hypothetical protein J3R30DRAFT_594323 [Lentinula aciculospora]|uniref:Swi5-domain-containing protein n=1 Tax=Lentinula aciculospora TaxID=153920 RepID=A0A9W9A7X8_9AGAR|nr:hypothetical protein J3R30DRAFT_594323 [Lentinula aciculospora]